MSRHAFDPVVPLIGCIYEAALDPARWSEVAAGIADAQHAQFVKLLLSLASAD